MREKADRSPVIVVGIDGSDASGTVLDWARSQAGATGATLRLVFAWHVTDLAREVPSRIESELSEAAQKRVAALAAAVPEVPTEHVVQEAGPVDLLLREAADADLLVLGSKGHGGAGAAPPGSVVRACLARATCPVVVVPVRS
jgi:nucleotide-binding universal stress UspA family protein